MKTLLPDELEAAAVVPQCLDNQYVSDHILGLMLQNGWDFDDKRVRELRHRDVHREFVRSIIYSQQVVVNRAYLINNPFFVSYFDGHDKSTQKAVTQLFKERAIVPFQSGEASLIPSHFDSHPVGTRALQTFLDRVGSDFSVVRLATSEAENVRKADLLANSFVNPLQGYNNVAADRAAAMLRELRRDKDVAGDEVKAFRAALRRLSDFVHARSGELADDDSSFTRNEVYKRYFCESDSNIAQGRFRFAPDIAPYEREIKKLIDLRYNTVLPDALNRFAFAPYGFPGRSALQDDLKPEKTTSLASYLESLDQAARSGILQSQHEDMLLPDFDDISMEHVVEIRELPEWREFASAQSRLLADPSRSLLVLPDFRDKLFGFQEALHRLFEDRDREILRRRCSTTIGVAIKFAGIFIPVGHHNPDWVADVLKILPDLAWELMPSNIRGMSVELLVNVADVNAKKRNDSHSYQMESIRNEDERRRDDIKEIVQSLQASKQSRYGDVDPSGEQFRA